jgi:hypothetical protein
MTIGASPVRFFAFNQERLSLQDMVTRHHDAAQRALPRWIVSAIATICKRSDAQGTAHIFTVD